MMNTHSVFVEVNAQHSTIRMIEKDKWGKIHGNSRDIHFNCGVDAMKLSLTLRGYKFHHGTQLVSVYEEV